MLVALILILASILLVGFYVWIIRTALEVEDEPSNDTFQDNPDGLGGVNLNFHSSADSARRR